MRIKLAVLFAVLLSPALAMGQALADRVPADAIIYVGWKGTDSPGDAYAQSHLQAVIAASQLHELCETSIPLLIEHIRRQDAQAATQIQMVLDLAGPMFHHPTAFYFGGVNPGGPPIPKIALLCQAGANAQAMNDQIAALLNQAGGPGSMVHVKTVDQLLIVSTFDMPDHPTNPLSADPAFKTAMAGLTHDPVSAFYLDGQALNTLAGQMVQQFGNPDIQGQWTKISTAAGLDGLKKIAVTCGFEGKNWVSQVFVDAPAPRHGMLQMFDAQPVSEELLRQVPQTSTTVAAGSFDLLATFDFIHGLVDQFAPQLQSQINQGIEQVNQMLGMNVRTDFLGAFGSQWASYINPATTGDGMGGIVILNRPRDAAKLAASMEKIENLVNQMVPALSQEKITLELRKETIAGNTIHFIAAPFVSPSWTIKNNVLYAGLFPQMVVAAVAKPAGKSILDNTAFQQVRKSLGAPTQVASIAFVDLPRTFSQSYSSTLMMSRMYLGMGDLVGLHSPPMVLPPLDKFLAELEPAGEAAWADAAGLHAKSIEPFPGATTLNDASSSLGSVGTDAMLVSILLPSLNRARETANRVKCASNLRQIGLGCIMYSNEHKGAYPPNLGTLLKEEDLTAAVFVCPSDSTTVPALPLDQLPDWVNANSDYIYVGAGLKQGADPTTIVAYEKETAHNGDGMNILYADGHVEFQNKQMAQREIAKIKRAAP